MPPELSPYITSLIAVAGTLLGAIIAGTFALIQLRRALRWQREDANRRYRLETERWAHTILEDRDKMLWSEQRVLYGRLLAAAETWIHAIRDMSTTDLPAEIGVGSLEDVESISPVAARTVHNMQSFARF